MMLDYITHTIVYIVLIALIHYLYMFFRNNLTTPKVIDLVNRPNQEYKKIYNTIQNNTSSNDMKNELKDYFKKLKHTPTTSKNTTSKPEGGFNTGKDPSEPITFDGGNGMQYSTF